MIKDRTILWMLIIFGILLVITIMTGCESADYEDYGPDYDPQGWKPFATDRRTNLIHWITVCDDPGVKALDKSGRSTSDNLMRITREGAEARLRKGYHDATHTKHDCMDRMPARYQLRLD